MTFLDHEVHPYVERPAPVYPLCICGLWRTHHLHVGISSAICTCMSCEESRNPTPITYTFKTTPDAPTGGEDPYTLLLDELDAPTEETDDERR